MAHVSEYRVRIWRPISQAACPDAIPVDAAVSGANGHPLRAATVETEHGDGPALVLALGSGHVHQTGYLDDPYDPSGLLLRVWEVDDAVEEIGATDLPGLLLCEFFEVLVEHGVDEIRLLTAEGNDADGSPTIVAASWFDPANPYGFDPETDLDDEEHPLDP